jgi:hypothetical protein
LQVTIHRIKRLTLEKVTFYTIQVDGNGCEFEDFKNRLCPIIKYRQALRQLFQLIESIGREHSAKEYFFKHCLTRENKQDGKQCAASYIEMQLGKVILILYCVRISDAAVILLNGDIRTNINLEKCNSKKHYELTRKLSQNIEEAILRAKNVDILTGLVQLEDNTPLIIY